MKFKDFGKRFLTLDRHRAEGFTLVELIVVIAILAILGGVAVPAYGGYVKKANMTADQQLVSEIEHALELAYYSQDLTEGRAGFILLSPNEGESMPDEDGFTALAMQKVFGSNWLDMMQLKYDNWGVSWDTISFEDATNVVNSSFVQNYTPNELMAQVQAVTDAVNGLQIEVAGETQTLYKMFNYGEDGNVIRDVMTDYGITKSWDDLSSTEKSNVLVLAAASSITNEDRHSGAASVISDYALYTAYAAENPEFNTAYQTFQESIANVDPNSADSEYDQIKSAYNTLKTAAGSGFTTWQESNADTNKQAFINIMQGVGNAMDENGDAIIAQLNDPNMFTSGIGNEMYNDYLNSAYAAAGTGGIADEFMAIQGTEGYEGMVLIQYVVAGGKLYVSNSLPVS